jgi:hypothetical protein
MTTPDGRPIHAWACESARSWIGMTQPAMAEALHDKLGRHFTAAMVRNVESGEKQATWEIVVAWSEITGFPLHWFRADPTVTASKDGLTGGYAQALLATAA